MGILFMVILNLVMVVVAIPLVMIAMVKVVCGDAYNGDRIETRKRDGHHCEGEQKK